VEVEVEVGVAGMWGLWMGDSPLLYESFGWVEGEKNGRWVAAVTTAFAIGVESWERAVDEFGIGIGEIKVELPSLSLVVVEVAIEHEEELLISPII
jgi:hypothetical protein